MTYRSATHERSGILAGRMNRRQYWAWLGSSVIITTLCGSLILGTVDDYGPSRLAIVMLVILYFFVFVLGVIMAIRRLHDMDFSAWWLLTIIPPLCILLIFFLLFGDGSEGRNRYGRNPEGRGFLESLLS